MKKILLGLAFSVSAVVASANNQCEPSFGYGHEVYTIMDGSTSTGMAAQKELEFYKNNKSEAVKTTQDLLGRTMFTEARYAMEAAKFLENTITDVVAYSRIDRYCSMSGSEADAKCVSLCVKWTDYRVRPKN